MENEVSCHSCEGQRFHSHDWWPRVWLHGCMAIRPHQERCGNCLFKWHVQAVLRQSLYESCASSSFWRSSHKWDDDISIFLFRVDCRSEIISVLKWDDAIISSWRPSSHFLVNHLITDNGGQWYMILTLSTIITWYY